MNLKLKLPSPCRKNSCGFSLEEVIMSMAIATIGFGAIISEHLLSFQTTEWTAYSIAAESLAHQRMEQTRAARWNLMIYPEVDELTASNFPELTRPLDIPHRAGQSITADVETTIEPVSTDPPLRRVRVDVVWSYLERGPFTNTAICFRSPDQ